MKYKLGSKLGTASITPKMNIGRTKLIQIKISNGDHFNSFKNTRAKGDSRMVLGLRYDDNGYPLRFPVQPNISSRSENTE